MTDLLTRIENNQPIEAQELYDFVVAAVVKQGRPSVGDNDRCLYRGPDGLKCAAGHVIPDSYSPEIMENSAILSLSLAGKLPGSLIRHARLLEKLQRCHDKPSSLNNYAFIFGFRYLANEVAKEFNLKPYGENT